MRVPSLISLPIFPGDELVFTGSRLRVRVQEVQVDSKLLSFSSIDRMEIDLNLFVDYKLNYLSPDGSDIVGLRRFSLSDLLANFTLVHRFNSPNDTIRSWLCTVGCMSQLCIFHHHLGEYACEKGKCPHGGCIERLEVLYNPPLGLSMHHSLTGTKIQPGSAKKIVLNSYSFNKSQGFMDYVGNSLDTPNLRVNSVSPLVLTQNQDYRDDVRVIYIPTTRKDLEGYCSPCINWSRDKGCLCLPNSCKLTSLWCNILKLKTYEKF